MSAVEGTGFQTLSLTGAAAIIAAAFALAPLPVSAASVWATWSLGSTTTATASLPDGRSATFTGFALYSVGGAGAAGTTSPSFPGVPSGGRPPVLTFNFSNPQAPPGNPGDLIGSLDLGNFGVDSETSFGLEDVVDFAFYRLELLDASLNALSLANVQLAQFNIIYTGGAGDYDISLNPTTGQIVAIPVHDSGDPNPSRHSGLGIFSNLPLTTRYVNLYLGGSAPFGRDGLRVSLGGSIVPAPGAAWLLGTGLLALVGRARRRLPSSSS